MPEKPLDIYEYDGTAIVVSLDGMKVKVQVYHTGELLGTAYAVNASRVTTKNAARQVLADYDERGT